MTSQLCIMKLITTFMSSRQSRDKLLSGVEPTVGSSPKVTIYMCTFRSLPTGRQASYRQDDSIRVIMHNGL